jgi:hypothetical protein
MSAPAASHDPGRRSFWRSSRPPRFGLSSALTTHGPSVVDRAAAALRSSDDTILHFQMPVVRQSAGTKA